MEAKSVSQKKQITDNQSVNRRNFLRTGSGLAVGMLVGNTTDASADPSNKNSSLDLFAAINTRRSVRIYQPTPVPKADIEKMIDAARMAPTAGNQQPWKFLVIQDQAGKDALKETCLAGSFARWESQNLPEDELTEKKDGSQKYFDEVFSAPVFIIILSDNESKWPTYNHHDGPLAAGYLLLAARAMGYGSVYYTDTISADICQKALNIPERYQVVCTTPIGIPEEWPETPDKQPLAEFIAYDTI